MQKVKRKRVHELDEQTVHPDPIKQFQHWFDEAIAEMLSLPEATTLATATKDGKPSARLVLLKKVDKKGFVFFTNYNSRKSKELKENPFATLVFYWEALHRQVRIEGTVQTIPAKESEEYFQTRTRESQISAVVSPQSEVVSSREELERRVDETTKLYDGQPVPRPSHWGGYRLKPNYIEFWQGQQARLHDRIAYFLRKDGNWKIKRLAP